jgi:hypothetical protein
MARDRNPSVRKPEKASGMSFPSMNSLTGEWLVDDVLQLYPFTSDIFIQHGPVMGHRRAGYFPSMPR